MRPHRLLALCSFVALTVLSVSPGAKTASAQDGESWSGWHATDGDGKIQYRWRTYGSGVIVPKCSYQLRNLDSSDDATYDSTVYYTNNSGKDETESGSLLNKTYRENTGNIGACTNVSSVTTSSRR